MPGVAGTTPPAAAAAGVEGQKEGSGGAASGGGDGGGGGGGHGDADGDLSNLYVALQGWVRHEVDDAEVRLRPRGAGAAGAVVSDATGAEAGASEGGKGAAVSDGPAVAASTSDSTNLAAAAVAAADAAAAAKKLEAAATPLPVLEDEVTEALKREQARLKETTRRNRETIDAQRAVLNPMVQEASSFA